MCVLPISVNKACYYFSVLLSVATGHGSVWSVLMGERTDSQSVWRTSVTAPRSLGRDWAAIEREWPRNSISRNDRD